MIATAVEDYEATFAGVEASLGFADCALIFVRERSGGCHLDYTIRWSTENEKSSRSGLLGKHDVEGVVALLTT